jgi:saccharopine dehydrogenase-like NADP-dependent oxidoreductase
MEVAGIEDQKDLAASISKKYEISKNAPAIEALDYLGFFDDRQISLTEGSPFDVLSGLMIEKMMLKPGDRDMVIMQHIFEVMNKDGSKEKIISSLLDFGDEHYTSIAKTVAYPAAIGAKMILEGKINLTGVHIPIKKEIYQPILSELRLLGIEMQEEFGLPV